MGCGLRHSGGAGVRALIAYIVLHLIAYNAHRWERGVGTGRFLTWVSFGASEKPWSCSRTLIQLSSGGFDSSVATAAPRIDAANPGAGEALGERIRGPIPKNKRNMTTIMGEWETLYGEVPPSSLLLAEVPADVRRARAGAEALAKRSDDGVGVNPSVFTYR